MKPLACSLVLAGLACAANAETITITQVGLSYSPASVTVSPGDVVRWVHTGGFHDVVHGRGCFEESSDGGILAGHPFFDLPLTGSNPIAEWTVPDAANGRIPYFCSVGQHCEAGMVGELRVVPRAGSNVVVIEQQGLDFIPLNAVASPGDTVVWNWNNGGHSVHTGDVGNCINDDYIALPLDQDDDQVIWQIPEDYPTGTQEYFCIYHCFLQHVGTVEIVNPCAATDINCDGQVNGADLAVLLASWGFCSGDCPPDFNEDGVVNGVDLAQLLGSWTS
ncbi:MAG: plastocyanin/azurin family copper-binding protein [Planctomycetota bacterium]|nr:plastocyanin/azurin family copper-binding protein [Planctomycetota bacterium]